MKPFWLESRDYGKSIQDRIVAYEKFICRANNGTTRKIKDFQTETNSCVWENQNLEHNTNRAEMGILGQRTNWYEYHAEAAQDPSVASPHFLAQNLAPDLNLPSIPKRNMNFTIQKKKKKKYEIWNMKYAPWAG